MPSPPNEIIGLAEDEAGAIWAVTSAEGAREDILAWTAVGPGWASPNTPFGAVHSTRDG